MNNDTLLGAIDIGSRPVKTVTHTSQTTCVLSGYVAFVMNGKLYQRAINQRQSGMDFVMVNGKRKYLPFNIMTAQDTGLNVQSRVFWS